MTSLAQPKGSILIVDDTLANLDLLTAMLTKQGYKVRAAINGRMAITSVFAAMPELILLDINMPDMNGFEVCQQLKADVRSREIPIIFISASDEILDKVQAFEMGCVDYITKPFQVQEVLARVASQLTLYQQKRELAAIYQSEIEYLRKLSAMKDEFLEVVSHDLKNPLARINLSLERLRRSKNLDEASQDKIINQIQRASNQMRDLIVNLLDLACCEARQNLHLGEYNLADLLQEVMEDFQAIAQEKGVTLTSSLAITPLFIICDRWQIEKMLANLISNALKYTPVGGNVSVFIAAEKDNATIRVQDTGLGIPNEDIPFLFQRFYRVNQESHRQVEGTGLGLAIVKTIVEEHNGTITVESELGKGSTFYIKLPLGISEQEID